MDWSMLLTERLGNRNGFFEHPCSPLRVRIFRHITGEGGNDFNFMLFEENRQVFIATGKKNGEITSVNNMATALICLVDQVFKMGIHFGCAASDVNRMKDP